MTCVALEPPTFCRLQALTWLCRSVMHFSLFVILISATAVGASLLQILLTPVIGRCALICLQELLPRKVCFQAHGQLSTVTVGLV